MTTIHRFDPLRDPRWEEFLKKHPHASVFHARAWIAALHQTYAYRSEVLTTSPPDSNLQNGILLCAVNSWLTGSRLVSVPFADHCEPLTSSDGLEPFVPALKRICRDQRLKYVEFRSQSPLRLRSHEEIGPSESYVFHKLDLRPCLDSLFRSFHKSCVQRKIHRAEREKLEYVEGSSDEIVGKFYDLMTLTRKRHGLPPQPLAWFWNLRECFGSNLKIRLALRSEQPLASILTLRFKNCLVYKYGCSDARYHHLGTMPWLFWQAIKDAKGSGLDELDLGRSSTDDEGLITFKEHLGAQASTLQYYRYPSSRKKASPIMAVRMSKVLSHFPVRLLKVTGNIMYRHIG